ncbi:MAG TPA: hypothetical protein VGL71_13710 [Urbifossiella sp.]
MPRGRRNLGRFGRLWAACFAISLGLFGCKSNKHYDGIEAELRTRNRELEETQRALERSREINRAYEQSRGTIPGAVPVSQGSPVGCSLREITLARGTGGVDDDAIPGDEYLMVVIVPTDEDRSAVKAAGRVSIAAWEYGPDGLKRLIGTWEVSAEQLRSTWKSGLLATGYFVPLQWQQFPTTSKVRVAVRLTATDGRLYEADRDISVRPMTPALPALPPIIGRQPLTPGVPPPGVPPVLPGFEELPPPKM